MSLFDRLNKVAKNNEYASVLSKSDVLKDSTLCVTDVPMLNVALSGDLNGGLESGILQIVGDSRTFKTCYALKILSHYMQTYSDATMIFIDSERGASLEYFDTFGIDKDRVLHVPVCTVEDMTIQTTQFLNEIKRNERMCIFIDSVGMLPSNKEAGDALDGKTVTDMTRAKALNSFWRIVTMPLALKNVPMIAINHYYDTMTMYPEKIIKGGKGGFLASDNIWIVSRSKIKDGTDLAGWSFNITAHKSRTIKEGAKIPIEVFYDNGINKYSGLLEVARATGHILMPKSGWYCRSFIEDDTNRRRGDMDSEFWQSVLENKDFQEAVSNMYKLSSGGTFTDALDALVEIDIDTETGEVLSD